MPGLPSRYRPLSTRTEATTRLAALNDPKGEFQKSYAKRGKQLEEQYAQARVGMEGQKKALGQEYARGLARQQAISGAPGGGASMKMQQKAEQGLAETYGGLEAGLASEKAAAMQNLEAQKAAEKMGREQFDQTLAFQKQSFDEQMKYSWAEFDENQKTNFVNAAALMKDAGFKDPKNMQRIYEALKGLYGTSRVPQNWRSPWSAPAVSGLES